MTEARAPVLPAQPEGRCPARLRLVSGQPRLALVCWYAGAAVLKSGEEHVLDPEGADLRRLNSGRGLLLYEHGRFLDHLLGVVEETWAEPPAFFAVVRFSNRPLAREMYDMLADGVPIGASAGFRVFHAEPDPERPGRYIARRWRPHEISLVVEGADEAAAFTPLPDAASLAALRDEHRADRLARERQARLDALRAEAWRDWAAGPAAAALAQELRVPVDRAAAVLARLTGRHLCELERAVAHLDELLAETP